MGAYRKRCSNDCAQKVEDAARFALSSSTPFPTLTPCALAELFERNTIVGYTTIDGRGRVPTFQTAVYPRLPTWPFSKAHGVPIRRPYVGTCAQAICERRIITCSNIATETGFDPGWRAACTEFRLRSVQSAPVFGFDGRPLGTFVTASHRPRHPFDHDMTGFGVYALRIFKSNSIGAVEDQPGPLSNRLSSITLPPWRSVIRASGHRRQAA